MFNQFTRPVQNQSKVIARLRGLISIFEVLTGFMELYSYPFIHHGQMFLLFYFFPSGSTVQSKWLCYEPIKTCLRGFRPGEAQTILRIYLSEQGSLN